MRQILSASAGVRLSRMVHYYERAVIWARSLRLLQSRISHRNRPIHRGKPDHRRPAAIFDALVLIVPRLARVIADARMATDRRVVRGFHHEAGLISARHRQGDRP